MKIFICESHFTAGGAERVVSNLANYLVNRHTVKVVSLTKSEMAYKMNKDVLVDCIDKKEYIKNKYTIKNIIDKIYKNLYRIYKLKKEIKEFQPDIILSFLPEPSFLTLFLKKKIPVIISVRNDPKVEYKKKSYYIIMKLLYPKANGIVFQTKEAKAYFDGLIKCPSKIIPNPINPEFIKKPFNGKRSKRRLCFLQCVSAAGKGSNGGTHSGI